MFVCVKTDSVGLINCLSVHVYRISVSFLCERFRQSHVKLALKQKPQMKSKVRLKKVLATGL